MRDLLFKNLTSDDKKRRVIASCEVMDKAGVHSVIQRHFICIIKEIQDKKPQQPLSQIYVVKEKNTREQRERFSCRIKGSVCAASGERLFLILFMHSLKIDLTSIPKKLNKV